MSLLERAGNWLRHFAQGSPQDLSGLLEAFTAALKAEEPKYESAIDRVLREIVTDWPSLYNADFVVGVLEALEKDGDGRVLYYVEHLANANAHTEDERRVQAAARACLPVLEARTAQQRASEILLRPAVSADNLAGILLRPVQGNREADPTMLLRPAASSGADEAPKPP